MMESGRPRMGSEACDFYWDFASKAQQDQKDWDLMMTNWSQPKTTHIWRLNSIQPWKWHLKRHKWSMGMYPIKQRLSTETWPRWQAWIGWNRLGMLGIFPVPAPRIVWGERTSPIWGISWWTAFPLGPGRPGSSKSYCRRLFLDLGLGRQSCGIFLVLLWPPFFEVQRSLSSWVHHQVFSVSLWHVLLKCSVQSKMFYILDFRDWLPYPLVI